MGGIYTQRGIPGARAHWLRSTWWPAVDLTAAAKRVSSYGGP